MLGHVENWRPLGIIIRHATQVHWKEAQRLRQWSCRPNLPATKRLASERQIAGRGNGEAETRQADVLHKADIFFGPGVDESTLLVAARQIWQHKRFRDGSGFDCIGVAAPGGREQALR